MTESGVVYQWISAVAQCISVTEMGVCVDVLLTPRENRSSRAVRILLWSIIGSMIICIKCFFPQTNRYVIRINPILGTLYYIFMLQYFYCDKPWIKLAHASIILLQNVLADALLYVLMGGTQGLDLQNMQASFQSAAMAERTVIIAALTILMNVVYTMAVFRRKKKGREAASPVWIAVLLPMFLMFWIMWNSRSQQAIGDSHVYMAMICSWTVWEFALAMFYMNHMEKREMQREAQRLAQAMELEKIRYAQIEARREEMAKLRHDYNNILSSVLFLVKNERCDEAKKMLADLRERISVSED
ncbi:MAG: hypothetical protein Q4C50_02235 [Eubacteriales bacterium]|nr:hypothetical protein [Eubacteriales bacterium]